MSEVEVFIAPETAAAPAPMDMRELGAHVSRNAAGEPEVRFGIYLPGITFAKGYELLVRIIHQADQFTPEIPPKEFFLFCHDDHPYDLWDCTVNLAWEADGRSSFGRTGNYLYRYQLRRGGQVITEWFPDPFARATGPGSLSEFTVPETLTEFTWDDAGFKVPELDDLIVYELQVEEFNDNFQGVIDRIPYLKGLGVNALELMPVTSIRQEFDWGYGPLHFFAPEERFGREPSLKTLVNACHQNGIAVILDSVYEHVDHEFAYHRVYEDAGEPSPMIGSYLEGGFGPETDFRRSFTRQYFMAVNLHWLNEFHVDGFRYDFVPGYYDGPVGEAYANLVFQTYQASLGMPRFQGPGGYSRIIQCAEQLKDPRGIMRETYSNSAWQNELLTKAIDMAKHRFVDDRFAHLLDARLVGYPDHRDANGVPMPVAPFQYVETHDHSRLITQFGLEPPLGGHDDVRFGDRRNYFKLQPFAIALYTCQGIPMLWQGQEFAENYTLPAAGNARIGFRRGVHWEYFYDRPGRALVRLYRVMARLRRQCRALRSRDSFYYNEHSRPGDQVIAYHRRAPATDREPEQIAMVFLNFSDHEQEIAVPFPRAGVYRERVNEDTRPPDAPMEIHVTHDGEMHRVVVPSNYGWVFIKD
jgi:1,4-alpha-glucan branching enzyme